MSFSGDGIAYGANSQGKRHALYFPGSCPGDVISVDKSAKIGTNRYETYSIIENSVFRRTPPCPYASFCSGCSYQHIAYEGQTELKTIQLNTLFGDILPGDHISIMPSEAEFRYRNKVTLLFRDNTAGFFFKDKSGVYAFKGCMLLRNQIDEYALEKAQTGAVPGYYGLTLYRSADGTLNEHYLQNQHDSAEFVQVNDYVNLLIRDFIHTSLSFFMKPLHILDLYCGNGNLSFHLGDIASSVTGLDISYPSIIRARSEAKKRGLDHFVFTAVPVEKAHEQILSVSKNINTLLIDPPRIGLRKEALFLSRLGIPAVIYISCNPVSLKKDTEFFLKEGYRIKDFRGFDMFPQTPHIESAVIFLKD